MITIPSEVKAALKDGSYAKNYRFETQVEKVDAVTYWQDVEHINDGDYINVPSTTGVYRIFGDTDFESCEQYITTFDGDEFVAYEITRDSNGTYVENIPAGATMVVQGGNAKLQKQVDSAENADNTQIITRMIDVVIDNNCLVSESVKITERMATGDLIKFGLCEGSNLEFEYFDLPSVKDCDLRAYIDVYYGAEQPYTIPMGTYTVDEISRQASTGIKKVTAYNKLQSKYLDKKANKYLQDMSTDTADVDNISVYAITNRLLNNYKIEEVPAGDVTGYIYNKSTSTGLSMVDNAFSFKGNEYLVNNTNTIYYPWYRCKSVVFEIPDGKIAKIEDLNKFKEIHNKLMKSLFSNIRKYCQNPEQVITNLKNSAFFQTHCGIAVGFNTYDGNVPNPHYYVNLMGVGKVNTSTIGNDIIVANVYTEEELPIVNNQLKYRGLINDADYFTDAKYICFTYITEFGGSTSSNSFVNTVNVFSNTNVEINEDDAVVKYYNTTPADTIKINKSQAADFSLRDLLSASYEINCQLGKLDRETDLFSGAELSQNSAVETVSKDMYSDLWYDKDNEQSWKYLIITYKGLDGNGNEAEYTLQRTINANGTQNYNCSGNWIFRNLIWTAEQVGEFADAMVAKMQGVTWFPFEMWCAGLPYLETGDKITIPVEEDDGTVTNHDTYILQRDLGGIQDLHDTYINGTLDIF